MMSPLVTDLYQLSMAQGYFLAKRLDDAAVFHLYFRRLPFKGGYAIAAGLEPALELIEGFRVSAEDTAYLATLRAADGSALFTAEFLQYLQALELQVDLDAMQER
jgi:nicotinate phosphoribosyltransferase